MFFFQHRLCFIYHDYMSATPADTKDVSKDAEYPDRESFSTQMLNWDKIPYISFWHVAFYL